jgi:serine-type D-Ala-D-Ala carboxypeptidase (penicillin-binding protein 5/6)
MSSPPFLTSRPRRSRQVARRRRRRRALAGAVLLAATIAIVGLAIAPATKRAGSVPKPRPHGALVTPRPSRSLNGLPLGRPELALSLNASHDPVNLVFHHPPRAGLLFDLDTGRVLWQHNATQTLPIASLTKMMTALVVVKSTSPQSKVLVTPQAVRAPGSKIGLLPLGKRIALETMLYGLLLPSGNDAAVALAEHVAGSVPRFVAKMNVQAARLGLSCTRLTSPDGFKDSNSSCATDLALLARADLDQPRIARVVASRSAVLPFPIKGGKLYLYNNNPLLRYGFPGITGLKTGETEAAGLCLVGTAQRGHVRLGVVLLHSPELARQSATLLNRAFAQIYHQAPIPQAPLPTGA